MDFNDTFKAEWVGVAYCWTYLKIMVACTLLHAIDLWWILTTPFTDIPSLNDLWPRDLGYCFIYSTMWNLYVYIWVFHLEFHLKIHFWREEWSSLTKTLLNLIVSLKAPLTLKSIAHSTFFFVCSCTICSFLSSFFRGLWFWLFLNKV